LGLKKVGNDLKKGKELYWLRYDGKSNRLKMRMLSKRIVKKGR